MRDPLNSRRLALSRCCERGFTLVELVMVIIILSVLAAVALPNFLNLSTAARVASVRSMAGTLWLAATNTRVMCKTNPNCNYNGNQFLNVGGRAIDFHYGWPEAGDSIGTSQIDVLVTYGGFIASLPTVLTTRFSVEDAPDPTNCSATYTQATSPTIDAFVTTVTSGC